MIEHKILINESYYDCLGKNGDNVFKAILKLYNIDPANDNYLFEYTRDLNESDNLKSKCTVYINKDLNLLKCDFETAFNYTTGKLALINNSYTLHIIPKSDIIKINIYEQKSFATLPCNMSAKIEFNNNNNIEFDLKDCTYEDSEKIIKFIIGLAQK